MSSCCGRRPSGACCSNQNGFDEQETDSEMKTQTAAVVGELLAKRKTILDVVEELGTKLTDPNVNERVSAVSHLTEVVVQLPKDFFISEEVATLLTFFTARLQDSILLLGPTLKSLQCLVSCAQLPDGVEQSVLAQLFKEVNVQSGAQEDRYRFYQIIECFVNNRIEGVISMGIDFVLGFIQAIEGEKDPRCLLLVFGLFRKICSKVPLHHLTDDMFEIVACYFPILFEPPPNDPYGVTSEDLSTALRRCLTAHPKFAALCMQLLEEQFHEDSAKTKLQAFLLMDEAVQTFPAHSFVEWATTLWNEIRKQTMTPRSNDLEETALMCLTHLVAAIAKCTEEDGRNSNLVVLVGQIFRDCEPYVSNPEMQLLDTTNRILMSASKADARVANQVAGRALPLYMEKYQTKQDAKKDYAHLLLDWCRLLGDMDIVSPLFAVRAAFSSLLLDDMMNASSSEIADVGFQISTLLLSAVHQRDTYWSDEQCIKIGSIAMETCTGQRTPSLTYLRTLATQRWSLVEKKLVPIANAKINHSTDYLVVLSSLVIDYASALLLIPTILKHLCVIDGSESGLLGAVEALRLVLELNSGQAEGSAFGRRYTVKDGILTKDIWRDICEAVRTASARLADLVTADGAEMMEGQLAQKVIGTVFTEVCDLAQMLVLYSDRFEEYVVDVLLGGIDLAHLTAASPVSILVYVERVVAAMTPQEMQKHHIQFYLPSALDGVDVQFGSVTRLRLARISACVVNKAPANSVMNNALDQIFLDIESNLRVDYMEPYAWLCKAVLLRNLEPFADHTLSKIFKWLCCENVDIAAGAVKALGIVLHDDPDAPLLSLRTGVQITFLAKQRIFSRSVALLTEGFGNCQSASAKTFCCQALRAVLSYMPKNAQCSAEMDKLLPLLYNAIQSDDQAVIESSVASLKQLITDSDPTSSRQLHPHVPMLCTRLAELAKSKTSDMNLRSSALECITLMASDNRIPAVILYPWRDNVLKQLASCLDDKKRLVREKAVAARNRWFLLG